jgi:hypothetical protein
MIPHDLASESGLQESFQKRYVEVSISLKGDRFLQFRDGLSLDDHLRDLIYCSIRYVLVG